MTKVPFFDLRRQYLPLREDILSEIAALCDQQNFILGAQVEELEQKIADLAGTAYGIGVSSGTDAQLLILMSLGIGPGDVVLTTPFTFFSTAGCISRVGATPIFIDIDPDTFALSPERLEEFLVKRCVSTSTGVKTSDGKRVCAVVPVHLFGLCGDMHSIMQLAARWNLPVIEDAVKAGGFLAGTPADIIEQLKAVEKRYPGLNRVSCGMALGTPLAVALEQLDRFANEVMPAFRIMRAAAAE